jgi:hypothetical protein
MELPRYPFQGCQMVYFQTKNPNLGKFWRTLDWKMLTYFMAICTTLQTFGIFYDHLLYFVFIWYIFPGFGTMYQEKSGNPDPILPKLHDMWCSILKPFQASGH